MSRYAAVISAMQYDDRHVELGVRSHLFNWTRYLLLPAAGRD